jgi:hydroxymethylpyrimidine/phosphomethylpyrimidine kinase
MKRALTIAGSDSGAGAGIQADLKTFAAHGVYGTSAITAVTAQNTVGVTSVQALEADMVIAQIEAVISDIGVDAAKTGMLATAAIVEAVAATVETLEIPFLVVDPVMVAKSGDALLEAEAVDVLKSELLRRAYVVTPNRMEAEFLSGVAVRSLDDARRAAERVQRLGPSAVIVKGGHLSGSEAVDLLFDGRQFLELRSARIETQSTHGTGCTFAAALAANLALGYALHEAAVRAKEYVTGAIRHGLALGRGHGPLDHFWNLRTPAAI